MAALDSELRKLTEKLILGARNEAEDAAGAALSNLSVRDREPHGGLTAEQRDLRNALRARARQLGEGSWDRGFELLAEEVAYEQWHRMLFARFLAENSLLMHPDFNKVAVTLEQCAALAEEMGRTDAWDVAASFASKMLPGIFRQDDPSAQVQLAPEGRAKLERILAELPPPLFTADDGLGWVYQFWQTKRKQEVSGSGKKIERLDLAAYSQLFTEDYMVRFLLENSLGAWWAARHPESPLLRHFEYLRFRDDGTPAAGVFPGWPTTATEVTVMDPCCGSGHFLVAAFEMLRGMRAEEEGLGEAEAADAVLRDNLFGLELDARCVQIAAFSLALAGWKAGGYRRLPALNLACSGIPVSGQLSAWTELADDDVNLRDTLARLYQMFRNASDLGSLINPAEAPLRDRMFTPDFSHVEPLLERALQKESGGDDPVAAVFGESARATARAALLTSRKYVLVATNVPYLGRGKQGQPLTEFVDAVYPEGKTDLATAFILRCRDFTTASGTYALVSPHYWLFLGSYKKLRLKQLREQTCSLLARLGPRAFETITGEVVNVALIVWMQVPPASRHTIFGLDVSSEKTPKEKSESLQSEPLTLMEQGAQLRNPDAVMSQTLVARDLPLLGDFATVVQGVSTGDGPRYVLFFWEVPENGRSWVNYQLAPEGDFFSGYNAVLKWEEGQGPVAKVGTAHKGISLVGKRGVAVAVTRGLNVAEFLGDRFDGTTAVVMPKRAEDLMAITAFMLDSGFPKLVRAVDQALSVTESSFAKVPFDRRYWEDVAKERFPSGLPEPYSREPTQWIFNGHPAVSSQPLQVAVLRALGYRWPRQQPDGLERFASDDGVAPLVSIAGVESATERVRKLLATAFDESQYQSVQDRILTEVGFGHKGLEAWLKDGFFEQHCTLFRQRPVIWHIWDGRRDGFAVLVNYHRLNRTCLERLTYTYLGYWIEQQKGSDDPQAEGRVVAALKLQEKLQLILEGEPPYDIYIRWSPLRSQPIGWQPDLNDGVRLNIRPFISADILRVRPNIKWGKDRGNDPDGSERFNDLHYTKDEKRAARQAASVSSGRVSSVR